MTVSKVKKDDPRDDRYYVRLYNPNGGYYKKVVRGKRAAAQHAAEMTTALAGGRLAASRERARTVESYLGQLIIGKATLAYNTRRTYANSTRLHIYPALGATRVRDLRYSALMAFFEGVEKDSGREARRSCESLLRLMLKAAVRDGVCERNPLDGVPFPKRSRVRGIPYAPELVDVLRVRDHMLTQSRGVVVGEAQQSAAAVEVLIGTGLRVGELVAIAPDTDIDYLRRTLTVSRALVYAPGSGFVFGPPKTDDSGRRTIPLPQFTLDALAALQARLGTHRITLPWEEPDSAELRTHDLLFRSVRTGHALSPANLQQRLARVGVQLSLPGSLHPHGLRHRYTTELHDAGVPQIVIDEITGHLPAGSVSMRTYTRPMEAGRKKARAAIEAAWADAQASGGRAHQAI